MTRGRETPAHARSDMTLVLRYAARSDRGLVRANNEDSVYAGARLLALADGMGGHAAGEVASQLVIAALAHLDDDEPGGDLLGKLDAAVRDGNSAIAAHVEADPDLEGMGTTLTAILFAGNRLGPGAHRRLPRLSDARRRADPDHQGRHLRADPRRRGPDHRRGGAQPPAAVADHAGDHRTRGGADPDRARSPRRGPLPAVLGRAVRPGQPGDHRRGPAKSPTSPKAPTG